MLTAYFVKHTFSGRVRISFRLRRSFTIRRPAQRFPVAGRDETLLFFSYKPCRIMGASRCIKNLFSLIHHVKSTNL
jgi:hypothetical protein